MGTEQEKAASSLKEKLEGIKCRWVKRTIKEVDDLEKELYAFKDEHSQNDDYKCLLVHIKNKITMDNNVYTETNAVATLMVSVEVFLISIFGIQNIVSSILLVSCALLVWPAVRGIFKNRTREKNFYEICLNIIGNKV